MIVIHADIATEVVLLGCSIGVAFAGLQRGWIGFLFGDQTGSKVARRLLPAALLIPFFNRLIEVRGQRLGLYDLEFGATLGATLDVLLFGTLIWWTATSLNRSETQRRAAEQKRDLYRQMFVHSNDSIAVIDRHGHYLEQNAQHERLLEYTSNELHGRTPAVYLGDAQFGGVIEEVNRTGSYRGELVYQSKSGKPIPIDLSAFSVRDEHGQVLCYVGMKRDITDRKRAEQMLREAHDDLEQKVSERTSALMDSNRALTAEISERKRIEGALRESEGRFRAIFNQASVGIAEVATDGRFRRVNAKLCEILGRSEQELIQTTFQALTHPDDLSHDLVHVHRTLEGLSDGYSIEKRYLRPDGTSVWCRLAVSLVRTASGQPQHFISVVEDISEPKRTTDALRTIVAATASVTDENFFRPFVAHLAPALGVRYAFVGELVEGNPLRIRTLAAWSGDGYGETVTYDLPGTPCERVIAKRVPCFYPNGIRQQFPTDVFLEDIGAESYYGLPLLDREGRVLGLLSVMHDQPLSLLSGMEPMLVVFAARAAVELERKRTLEALRFSDQALRQLIDEREQLAQDLHDGIIQSIYAAGLGLEEARRLVQEGSPAAVGQIRTVISDLNSLIEEVRTHIVRKPREIKNGYELKLALERLVRVLRTNPAVEIVAVIDRAAADRLRPGEATHVYYIAAEALTNAVRHSQARHCSMALRILRGMVRLEVSDDGRGFDPAEAHPGHGLRNLAGRAAKLGTRLCVSSSPSTGTCLIVDVPEESSHDQSQR